MSDFRNFTRCEHSGFSWYCWSAWWSLASPRPSNIRVFLASRSRRSLKSPMIHPGCPGLVKLRSVQPPTKQVEASVPYYPFLSRLTSFTENDRTADKISPTGITDSAGMGVIRVPKFQRCLHNVCSAALQLQVRTTWCIELLVGSAAVTSNKE